MSTPTREELARITDKRDAAREAAEQFLTGIQEARGGDAELTLGEQESLRAMSSNLRSLERRATEYESELQRVGTVPAGLARRVNGGRSVGSAAALCPLGFSAEELRSAHARVGRGESVVLESRFVTADSLIPAQLFPIPTFPRHEDRLL